MEFPEKTDKEFEELFMTIINPSQSSKDSSYKFAFARFLIEYSRYNDKTKVSFSTIADYFLKYYWTQECRSKLNQSSYKVMKSQEKKVKKSIISSIIIKEFGDHVYPDFYEKIKEKFPQKIQNCISQIEKKSFHDVVYAFQYIKRGKKTEDVSPTFFHYGITGMKKRFDRDADKPLIDLKKGIEINPYAMRFFKRYHAALEKAVILEWVRFIEKFNVGVPALVEKIEGNPEKRKNLSKERKILYSFFKKCFYCNDILNPKNDSKNQLKNQEVEHVIPFSFIREDEMWNFVLSCKECNCKKLGALPPKEFLKCLYNYHSKYTKKIPELEKSLGKLGEDPQRIINNHYDRAKDLGFLVYEEFPKLSVDIC